MELPGSHLREKCHLEDLCSACCGVLIMFLSGNFLKFYQCFKKMPSDKSLCKYYTPQRAYPVCKPTTCAHIQLFLFLLGGYIITPTIVTIYVGARSFYEVCSLISVCNAGNIYPAPTLTSTGPSKTQLDFKPYNWKPCLPTKHSTTHLP